MSTNSPVAARSLSRAAGDGRPAAPVRMVHLGLGNFFRAHQAAYTDLAPDADAWGIAAFTGRSTGLADALTAQDGLFTLVVRDADGDTARIVGSISRAHAGADHAAWLRHISDPRVAVVTLTVTEAGYLRGPDGGLDADHPGVRRDLLALRADPTAAVDSVPARLVAGLAARRRAGAGPVALVSCDNLTDNGGVTARVVTDCARLLDAATGEDLAGWIADTVGFVTTMVDRITPAGAPDDGLAALELTGRIDDAPVVTEPFTEWVLAGDFPAGRPAWHEVGARFVDDVAPFEERKLWLLNGAHSLLAYAGSARGHRTVAEAVADPACRDWMTQWWDEASAHLALPAEQVAAYRRDLLLRFANPRIRHLLAQIAADGSQKVPVRILPVLRRERRAGRVPAGSARVVAAWINHLRGAGAPVKDPAADRFTALARGPVDDAVAAVLDHLDPGLGADRVLVDAVAASCRGLAGS